MGRLWTRPCTLTHYQSTTYQSALLRRQEVIGEAFVRTKLRTSIDVHQLTTTTSPPLYIHLTRDTNMADDTEENRDTEGGKVYIRKKELPIWKLFGSP